MGKGSVQTCCHVLYTEGSRSTKPSIGRGIYTILASVKFMTLTLGYITIKKLFFGIHKQRLQCLLPLLLIKNSGKRYYKYSFLKSNS